MKRDTIAAVGGAILAAWIPFWTFASSLSTIDFFRTSGGHPSIGTLYLPAGVSAGLTVLGIFVMVWVFVRHSRGGPGAGSEPQSVERPQVLSGLDAAKLADTQHQLLSLTHFERFAVWQLLLKDGITGEYFADLVLQYGIPIASLAGQRDLASTFSVIQAKSALLTYDPGSARWTIRPEFKNFVHYVIAERLSPVFGI